MKFIACLILMLTSHLDVLANDEVKAFKGEKDRPAEAVPEAANHAEMALIDNVNPLHNVLKEINAEYLQSIKPVFIAKCIMCHSSTAQVPWYGKIPPISFLVQKDIREGTEIMDMALDFPFKNNMDNGPVDDLELIIHVIDDNEMPPIQYKLIHWSSSLTKEEGHKIKQWAIAGINKIKAVEGATP